jgi:hypothetical protein
MMVAKLLTVVPVADAVIELTEPVAETALKGIVMFGVE